MDETTLHRRLERRLTVTLVLVVGLYLIGGVAAVVWTIPTVTPWHGAVAVIALGLIVGVVAIARRRRARG